MNKWNKRIIPYTFLYFNVFTILKVVSLHGLSYRMVHGVMALDNMELIYGDYFALRLSKLRAQKGVSARDMSLSIGQNQNYINNIENGKSLPSMTAFFYICEYLEITPSEFFALDSNAPEAIRKVTEQLKKLSPEYLEHISAIVEGLSDRH